MKSCVKEPYWFGATYNASHHGQSDQTLKVRDRMHGSLLVSRLWELAKALLDVARW